MKKIHILYSIGLGLLLAMPMFAKEAKFQNPKKEKSESTKVASTKNKEKRKQHGDADAASKAFSYVIKEYQNNLNDTIIAQRFDAFIEKTCKKFKGDPGIYKNVASAFWYNNADTVRAMKYANKAIALDVHYAPAYIVKGEVYAWCKDSVKAKEWYERAITANPTDAKGYEALAKIDMYKPDATASEQAYQRAKSAIASYPANLKIARMYDLRANRISRGQLADAVSGTSMTNVIHYYEKAERDSMEAYDYSAFAMWIFASGKLNKAYYTKALETAEEGLLHFPRDPQLNRMALYAAVESRQFKKATAYADSLMTYKDSTINHQDYRYVARAIMGKGNQEKAITAFNTLIERHDATDDDRTFAIGQIATIYKDMGEYDKADKAYSDYIASRKEAGRLSFLDLWTYAQMYMDKAEESNGDAVVQAYMKADEIYADAAKLDLEQAGNALYKRFIIRTNETIDPGYKKGMAVEPAKELVALLQSKSQLTGNRKAFLTIAYNYLGVYYLNVKEDKRQSLMYWRKLHNLDPTNENAIKAITKVFKQSL